MLEACTAAGRSLRGDVPTPRALCLTEAAIPAPCVMTTRNGVLLDCHVNCTSGATELRSTNSLSSMVQVRLTSDQQRLDQDA